MGYPTPGGRGFQTGKPNGPNSGTVFAIVGLVIAVVLAAAVAFGAAGLRAHNANVTGTAVAASSQPPTADPDATSESASPTDSECPTPQAGPDTPAGWQTVTSARGLAYDVPADWTVLSCGTLIGWEKKCVDGPFGYCPIRTMSGAASLKSDRCPKTTLADAGLPGASDTSDIDQAVRNEASLVKDIFTSDSGRVPLVKLTTPREFTVGGARAVQIVAGVTGIEPSACQGTTALHSMVATTVPGQPGSVIFVISLPQGVQGAVDPAMGDKMVDSLRRAS